MSNNIADLTSCPVRVRVEVKDEAGNPTGRILEYQIHPLSFRDHGPIQRWIDEQTPDPFAAAWEAIERQRAKGEPFNVAQEQFILRNAAEMAMRPRNLIGTPVADALLTSAAGIERIIVAAIRKGDPSFDDAKADELMKHMSQLDLLKAYTATQMPLVISDPKATPLDVTPPSKPTGSGGSRRTRRAATARTGGKPSIR